MSSLCVIRSLSECWSGNEAHSVSSHDTVLRRRNTTMVLLHNNGSVTQHTSGQAENLKNAIDWNPIADLKHDEKHKNYSLPGLQATW